MTEKTKRNLKEVSQAEYDKKIDIEREYLIYMNHEKPEKAAELAREYVKEHYVVKS